MCGGIDRCTQNHAQNPTANATAMASRFHRTRSVKVINTVMQLHEIYRAGQLVDLGADFPQLPLEYTKTPQWQQLPSWVKQQASLMARTQLEKQLVLNPEPLGRHGTQSPKTHDMYSRYLEAAVQELEELIATTEAKASKDLCTSNIPDKRLGASNLSSCKSQGYRARDGQKSHKIGSKRIKMDGKKIKGKKYGGPIPDYS